MAAFDSSSDSRPVGFLTSNTCPQTDKHWKKAEVTSENTYPSHLSSFPNFTPSSDPVSPPPMNDTEEQLEFHPASDTMPSNRRVEHAKYHETSFRIAFGRHAQNWVLAAWRTPRRTLTCPLPPKVLGNSFRSTSDDGLWRKE